MTPEQQLPLAGQMVVQVCQCVSCFLTHLHIYWMGESSVLIKRICAPLLFFNCPSLASLMIEYY